MSNYKSGLKTKATIYNESYNLFYDKGYIETKIDDILTACGINKGSFYHHYTDKIELGYYVYMSWGEDNRKLSSLFVDHADKITRLCIEIRIFWEMVTRDKNLMRFVVGLTQEKVTHLSEYSILYAQCEKLSGVTLPENQRLLISNGMVGLNDNLLFLINEYPDKFTGEMLSDFYLDTLFTMYRIDKTAIDDILERSKKMLSLIELSNDKFHITGKLKKNIDFS